MSKTFEVAKYEYTHHVARPRFWIALLSVPLGIVLVMLFAAALSLSSMSKLPVGYVDEANLITKPFTASEKPSLFEPVIPMVPFASAEEARAAAERGDIQAYFVVPQGYESTFQVKYYFNEPLTSTIRGQIRSLLTENLFTGVNIPNQARLEAGSLYTLISLDGTRSTAENEIAKIIVPLVVGMLFVIVVLSSGGYLLQAVVGEKENRTMELMVTFSRSINGWQSGRRSMHRSYPTGNLDSGGYRMSVLCFPRHSRFSANLAGCEIPSPAGSRLSTGICDGSRAHGRHWRQCQRFA